MRSTTFDMVGMALMALAIVLTVGGGITWAYLRETRGGPRTSHHEKRRAVPERHLTAHRPGAHHECVVVNRR